MRDILRITEGRKEGKRGQSAFYKISFSQLRKCAFGFVHKHQGSTVLKQKFLFAIKP